MKKFIKYSLICMLALFIMPMKVSAYSANISLLYERTGSFTSSSNLTSDGKYKDTYMIKGVAGQTIEISLMSSDFDSYLIILDSDSKRVAYDDDGGSGRDSYLEYTFPYTGDYSIVASQYSKATGSYDISVKRSYSSSFGDLGDDYDSAETIYIEDRYTDIYAELDHDGDEDYYFFEAPVTGEYRISTVNEGTDVDTYGELSREDTSYMKSDDNSGSNLNFSIRKQLYQGRKYYIMVAGSYGDEIGEYHLEIKAPITEISIPLGDFSYRDVKVSEPIADNGFRANRDGFHSANTIRYKLPESNEGVCFGMSAVSVLNYRGLLQKTSPVIKGFSYDITGIEPFEGGDFYDMTGSSRYTIGTLWDGFAPADVTVNSTANERIGQAVGWFQSSQPEIRSYKASSTGTVISTGGPFLGVSEMDYIENLSDDIEDREPIVLMALDYVHGPSHCMVPIAMYKVVNEDTYLLELYDPNYPGQENYAEIYVDEDNRPIGFNVIRMGLTSQSQTSVMRFLNLRNYVNDNM